MYSLNSIPKLSEITLVLGACSLWSTTGKLHAYVSPVPEGTAWRIGNVSSLLLLFFHVIYKNPLTDHMVSTRKNEQRKKGNAEERSNNCLEYFYYSLLSLQWFFIWVNFRLSRESTKAVDPLSRKLHTYTGGHSSIQRTESTPEL